MLSFVLFSGVHREIARMLADDQQKCQLSKGIQHSSCKKLILESFYLSAKLHNPD
jgi:hypothetical protein